MDENEVLMNVFSFDVMSCLTAELWFKWTFLSIF